MPERTSVLRDVIFPHVEIVSREVLYGVPLLVDHGDAEKNLVDILMQGIDPVLPFLQFC